MKNSVSVGIVDTGLGQATFLEAGAADSPEVVVLIHGVGTSSELYRPLMETLSGEARLIAPDLPLHGRSPAQPGTDFSLSGLTTHTEAVLDALGIGTFHLVANDTGGAIAQLLACRRAAELRSLVLTDCDTIGNIPPEAFKPTVDLAAAGQLAVAATALLDDLALARSSVFGNGFEDVESISLEMVRAFLEPVLGTPERAKEFERLLVEAMRDDDLRAAEGDLAALKVPTLLVWGTDDVFFGLEWAKQLLATIPGAREIVEVPGGRLFFPLERPQELAAHLRRFWSEVLAGV